MPIWKVAHATSCAPAGPSWLTAPAPRAPPRGPSSPCGPCHAGPAHHTGPAMRVGVEDTAVFYSGLDYISYTNLLPEKPPHALPGVG